MSHDHKSWEEFNKLDEQKQVAAAMYTSFASTLKPKGSNFTPPKKKRKKK